jgi:hypothetical protein
MDAVRQAIEREKRMIRNFKVLGLAVMAVLALSAVAASSASAQNGTITSTGNYKLTGTEIAGKTTALTAFGLAVSCEGSTYTGYKFEVTPHTFIVNDVSTFTILPDYNQPKCKTLAGPSTVDMNGCDYNAHLKQTTGNADEYFAEYSLVCPAGKDVTVTNWFSAAEHAEGKEACVIHIAPQGPLSGGRVKDTTTGDLELTGPVKGIKAVETKDGLHALLCPAKETVAGELDLNVTVKADNEAGGSTSISLSHL